MENLKKTLAALVRDLPDDCDWRMVYCRLYIARKLASILQDRDGNRIDTTGKARQILAERARARRCTAEHLEAMKAWLDRCESYS